MKRVALLIASILLLSGCAETTTKRFHEDGIPIAFYFVSDTPRGFKLFTETQKVSQEMGI